MIRAITMPRWRRRSKSRAGRAFPPGARRRQSAAGCAASASSPISRPAAWHLLELHASSAHVAACSKAPLFASIHPATLPSSPARIITAKAMRQYLPRSSAICSACRAVLSKSSMATLRAAPSVSVLMARVQPRLAALPSPRRSARSSIRAEKSPATCSKPANMTLNSPPDGFPLDILKRGLEETAFFDPVNFTFPGGCHVAEVEIDPATGELALVAYTAVDDVGVVLNPMIVEGQIHGGVTQGAGQALGENCVYDPSSGQLLTGSFMDYQMPRADDLPPITVATKSTRCRHNPLGVKGCGEVGTIASPATVMN